MAVEYLSRVLDGNAREFLRRVWSTDQAIYQARCRAIGFVSMSRVLDAGCGMGQWTYALAALNEQVIGLEIDPARVKVARALLAEKGAKNAQILGGNIECTGLRTESVDGIFCYSVIYAVDIQKTLSEFFRLLRPGGRLYLVSNGIGYHLRNLLEAPNQSQSYDVRSHSRRVLRQRFLTLKRSKTDGEVLITRRGMLRELRRSGFGKMQAAAEGDVTLADVSLAKPFYRARYLGFEVCYEILAFKD